MTPSPGSSRAPHADLARRAWFQMSDLVLDNQRKKEVAEVAGMSFGRVRALRRLARASMSMGELAAVLGIDAPYATVVVDGLEAQGLVRRRPHPTDRRAKLVEATRKGREVARRAEAVLEAPPPGLAALGPEDLATLGAILDRVAGQPSEHTPGPTGGAVRGVSGGGTAATWPRPSPAASRRSRAPRRR